MASANRPRGLPDGTTAELDTLHVRATEYTVGESGPEALPAKLPEQTAYTYAVELSVDEAEAMGAERVQFDKPVRMYVDNFLHWRAGTKVPARFGTRAVGCRTTSERIASISRSCRSCCPPTSLTYA